MTSIFFRVYLGILAALVTIAVAALLGYRSWHNSQLDTYLAHHSHGTLTLVADGVERHQGAARQQWLELARRVTSLDIELSEQSPPAEARTLQSGSRIEKLGIQQRRLFIPLPGQTNGWLKVTLGQGDINQQFMRGSQLLILNDLGRFPRSQRQQRLAHLNDNFSTGLQWLGRDELSLSYIHQRAAARGDTVVEFITLEQGDLAMRAVSPIGNSGDVLAQGPLPLFDPLPETLTAAALAVALGLLAISCFALIKPLERRLVKMTVEVERLDPESDQKPITVSGNDELTSLAQHINAMARRISTLLKSQRELNQAVSHELKTPLAKLKFHRELAEVKLSRLEHQGASAVASHLDSMSGNIDQLGALVEEILLYSRLESDLPPMTMQNNLLLSLLEESWSELERQHEGYSLVLNLEQPDCYADRFYLQRALQNLLSNACRYGASAVEVTTQKTSTMLEIHVDDDGPGVPDELRDRILEPFYRIEASRNRALGGTGLGLSIVQQIARWHHGQLMVSTSPLGGARFTLALPLPQTTSESAQQTDTKIAV